MTAVWLLARTEVRHRWAALLGLAVIVAVVTAVVLTAVVGARRTATTLDRYRQWSSSSDAGIQLDSAEHAEALVARLRTLPFVESAETRYLVNGFPTRTDLGIADFAVYFDPHDRYGTTVDRVRLLSGRLPRPRAADEIALTELTAKEMHVSIGDHLRASTFDSKDLEALGSGKFPGFHGRHSTSRWSAWCARPTSSRARWCATASTASARRGSPPRIRASPRGRPRSRCGCETAPVTCRSSSAPPISSSAEPGRIQVDSASQLYQSSTQKALDALTSALVVFAVVAGAAGAVLVAQTLSRQIVTAAGSTAVLRSLGLTRWPRA